MEECEALQRAEGLNTGRILSALSVRTAGRNRQGQSCLASMAGAGHCCRLHTAGEENTGREQGTRGSERTRVTRARSACVSDGTRVLSGPAFIASDSPDSPAKDEEEQGGGSCVPVL